MTQRAVADWAGQRERGNGFLVRIMLFLALRLGWRAGQALLYPVTLWFVAGSPQARAASRAFLTAALGRPAGMFEVYRHFLNFAAATLDRIMLLAGRVDGYRVDATGLESLDDLLERGQGCILMGSHLGSFEVLRALAQRCPARIRPLMYLDNGGALAEMIARLSPALARDVIALGGTGAMLEAREAVGRGELVGILGDRAPHGMKSVALPFLGRPALFPAGPMILAATLGVPVFLFFGIRTGPRSYRVHLEKFADAVTLERATRQADLHRWVGKYASRLEDVARENPYNWFNFYDFWRLDATESMANGPAAVRVGRPGIGAAARAAGSLAARSGPAGTA